MLRLVLILSFVGFSLQRGVKPQQSPGGNQLYPSEYVRGAGSQQPGNPGPLGAKAGGKYPTYPSQGYQQGPAGLRNGYGGLGVKPRKSGYGNGNYPSNLFPQGLGTKPSKAGYGAGGYPNIAAQGGYGNGAAGYPSNIPQSGYGGKPSKSGYGAGNYPQFGAQAGYGAGNYPQAGEQPGYGAGSYPQFGVQAGYGNRAGQYNRNLQQPGYGAKPSKAGYGAGRYPNVAQGGYRNGNGGYPKTGKEGKAGYGYGAGNFPSSTGLQGGIGKPSKAGYGNGAGNFPSSTGLQGGIGKPSKAGYGNGAGNFPSSTGLQGGIGKPSKAGAGYPSNIYPQGLGAKASKAGLYQQPYSNGLANYQGNGKGIKSPLSANQGPVGESSKLGAFGQLPYRSQPLAADPLGYDPKSAKTGGVISPYGPQNGYPDPASSKYAGEAQTPFIPQSVPQDALQEEIAPSSSVEGTQSIRPPITPTSPSALKQKPQKGGYQQLGAGQSPWAYAPEESAYGQNGYYGNGYRGCAGKC